MRTPPTGTVTLLFPDIEGSTRLLQRLGDRYPAVLATHQQLLRAAFQAQGGYEVRTEGDSFFVVFTRAGDAVNLGDCCGADKPGGCRVGSGRQYAGCHILPGGTCDLPC